MLSLTDIFFSAYALFRLPIVFAWYRLLTTVLLVAACLAALFTQSLAAEFCVRNDAEMSQALATASANKADDIIRITTGADLSDFQLKPETGYTLKIIGGWDSDCATRIARLSHPAAKVRTDLQPSYFEPHLSTSGPKRPSTAMVAEPQAISGKGFGGGSEVSIVGVPAYLWRHGCGPTAVGMIAGYYALNGYDDLLDGSSSTQTDAVQQMIASQGSSADPGNYEDYCEPLDYTTIKADKSEAPAGDEHTDDSIADFMKTSQSVESLLYGWSWSDDIIPAFVAYAPYRSSAYTVTGTQYYMGTTLTWSVLTTEINANRPMAFLVDSDGDGTTDHFVAVIGYRDSPSQQYACYDTWDNSVHWYNFRAMSSSYIFGVWGGMAFTLSGGTDPEPDPDLVEAARLLWQKTSNGKVAWWKIATTGKIFNTTQGNGWDFVSDTLTLDSAWQLSATTTINSSTALIWQKQTSGKVAYWKLASDYSLQDETQDSGWGYVSDTLTLDSAWSLGGVAEMDVGKFLVWQKQTSGKVAWWKLGDDGKLTNDTQNDGWGYVSDTLTLNSAWRLAAITDLGGYKNLIWQQQSNGKVAFWKLNTNGCTLQNTSQGDGWDYVSDSITLDSAWRLAAITTISSVKYMLWQKTSNGKVAWWKLSDSGKLENETQDSGWGFVSDELTLNSAWTLGGVATVDSLPVLIWQKQSNGKVAYWKLTSACKLQDTTPDSGWGFVSDTLTLDSNWRLVDVLQ